MLTPRQIAPEKKRLLALDGGGIMGVITLQMLKRIEEQLRASSGNPKLVLSDFFDYIGGTSTGAIIATGLAMGKTVDELIEFYDTSGPAMFAQAGWLRRLWHALDAGPLTAMLKRAIGERSILDMVNDHQLKSLLLVVTRNATTDSCWPLSTNPKAKYNDPSHPQCNLKIPLWKLVRASTAAPTFFKPEVIRLGSDDREFVDGGITPHNNPAFLLFKMATLKPYNLCWPMGEDKLMLVSLGTGFARSPQLSITSRHKTLLGHAKTIPGELMRAISQENDVNCRMVGRCVHGASIDREIEHLIPEVPLSQPLGRAFLYARYDADISAAGLEKMGLAGIARSTLTMENIDAIEDMKRIGKAAADQIALFQQFAKFVPPPAVHHLSGDSRPSAQH